MPIPVLCSDGAPLEIRVRQRQTWRDSVLLTADTGQAINLTGKTAWMQVRKPGSAPGDVLVTLTTGNGGLTIPDPPGGEIFFLVAWTVTLAWEPGEYIYDLFTQDDTGADCMLAGPFIVMPAATQVGPP